MKKTQLLVKLLDGEEKGYPVSNKTYGEDLLSRVFQDLGNGS